MVISYTVTSDTLYVLDNQQAKLVIGISHPKAGLPVRWAKRQEFGCERERH